MRFLSKKCKMVICVAICVGIFQIILYCYSLTKKTENNTNKMEIEKNNLVYQTYGENTIKGHEKDIFIIDSDLETLLYTEETRIYVYYYEKNKYYEMNSSEEGFEFWVEETGTYTIFLQENNGTLVDITEKVVTVSHNNDFDQDKYQMESIW